jgi:hypothetical protein
MADTQTTEEPSRRIVPPVNVSRFKSSEHVRREYVAYVQADVAIEDVCKRDFWKHVARDIRPGDHIEVVCEDMTWRADLFVVSSGAQVVDVKVINKTDLTGIEIQEDVAGTLRVQWRGPFHKHSVVRGKEVILTGYETSDAAMAALMDYRKNVLKAA